MTSEAERARDRAIGLAAETMGEIVSFWGFKTSMGRIWTLLYLTPEPMPADQIAERTRLSAGAVSMALAELAQWGLVARAAMPDQRKRHYRAETEIWSIVRRIVRERELRLVERSVARFAEAIALLEAAGPDDPELAFVLERLRGLHGLARIGHGLVKKLADVGSFSLLPIRGTLSRGREAS